jgi:uncharacterized Zn finger protein
MPNHLSQAWNEAAIKRLAEPQTWQRGFDYFSHGHVESVSATDAIVRATVRGTEQYQVTLSAEDGVPDYTCNCPQGLDGVFCKHCVAAALAWISPPTPASRRKKAKEVTLADAAKALHAEDHDKLVKMLLGWAKEDERLHERLILYAARRAGPESGAAAADRAFAQAVRVRSWARDVSQAIDAFEALLSDGQPAAAIESCESALKLLVEVIEHVDDSDGHFNFLRDRLQEIHYRACLEARPAPAELAKRLFHLELTSEFDIFYGAAATYSEILGPEGLTAYRKLAEAVWAKVPARTDRNSGRGDYFRITQIMQSLAKACGDIEELVSVMRRDLSSSFRFLQIAEVYRDASQFDKALHWGEEGMKAFPVRPDSRLKEFLAEEYHRLGRHNDAMNMIWSEFTSFPTAARYAQLRTHAMKAAAWPEWRMRALAEIRSRIAGKGDRSVLVQIFFDENDPEQAWREAQEGGCYDGLWLELAERRERDHPEDAAPIFLRLAETEVARVKDGRYQNAVALLAKTAAVMKRLGKSAEFGRSLDSLRGRYKIKRNLIRLIEEKRKSLYL